MHGAALIWSDMQRKCVAVVYCALVLVGRIPALLFTEIRVQDWFKHE